MLSAHTVQAAVTSATRCEAVNARLLGTARTPGHLLNTTALPSLLLRERGQRLTYRIPIDH